MSEPSEKKVNKPKAASKVAKEKSPLEQSILFTLFAHNKFHHDKIAEKLGLSRVSLMTKKKDPGRFFVRELLSLATILDVTPQEMLEAVLEYNTLLKSLEKAKPVQKSKKSKEKE